MNDTSGVGVLDKAVSVLAAAESGPATLAQLVDATGLARPTAHRIAVALERHRLLARDVQGRFVLGPRIAELASAAGEDRLLAVAQPVLIQLRDATGESAQLYRRQADVRVCVAAAERASGLRDTVPVGAALPMTAGSAAQVLLAWEEGERMHRGLRGAKFTATTLAGVRRRGWAASAAEREAGVASVSAPVRGAQAAGGRAAGCSPRSRCPGRSSGSPGRPGGCTRPRWWRRARRSASCCGPSGRRPGRERRLVQVAGAGSVGPAIDETRAGQRRSRSVRDDGVDLPWHPRLPPRQTPDYHQQVWSRPGAKTHKLHVSHKNLRDHGPRVLPLPNNAA